MHDICPLNYMASRPGHKLYGIFKSYVKQYFVYSSPIEKGRHYKADTKHDTFIAVLNIFNFEQK